MNLIILFLFLLRSNVFVVGDSITASPYSYVNVLQNKTSHTYSKYGFPGKTSRDINAFIQTKNLTSYSTLIIECGINNVYEPDRIIKDLVEITKHAKQSNPKIKVIVLTLPPYKGYASWSPQYQKNLIKVNNWIMSSKEFVGVDIYTPLSDKDRSKYSNDKLHPNKKGHEIMAFEILNYL